VKQNKKEHMSIKGSNTTADFLNFDETNSKAMKIIKSSKDANLGFLVLAGINMGIRIGDILNLQYEDFDEDNVFITENKTKKKRTIRVNENVRDGLNLLKLRTKNAKGPIFMTNRGAVYSTQYVNRWLKVHFGSKKIKVSSHSLRKTFGRRVWVNNNENEKALVYLSELFNHSSLAITKRYIGIRQEELNDIYMSL
jgi:integrase